MASLLATASLSTVGEWVFSVLLIVSIGVTLVRGWRRLRRARLSHVARSVLALQLVGALGIILLALGSLAFFLSPLLGQPLPPAGLQTARLTIIVGALSFMSSLLTGNLP